MINRVEYILNKNDYTKIRELISKEELLKPIENWNNKAIRKLYEKVLEL